MSGEATGTTGGSTGTADAATGGAPGATTQTGGASGSGATATQVPVVDWTSSLPEAQKMFVNQKGFKDPGMVLDSYKNLETLMGAPKERLVKMPEKADDAAGWNEVYDKLGRPKAASEYTFKVPEGVTADPNSTKFAQDLFHKAGLTKAQGEAIANEWNNYAVEADKGAAQARIAQAAVEKTALTKEWGGAWNDKVKACAAAMQSFGLDAAAVTKLESALGYSATMKFLSDIGSKVGESKFVTGDGSGAFQGSMTPDQARAVLAEKRKDSAWTAKYVSGDSAAREEMAKIMRAMTPEDQS